MTTTNQQPFRGLPPAPSRLESSVLHELFGDRAAEDGTLVRDRFAEWFGASALRDEAGRPRILFHGTCQSFDRFRVSPLGFFGAGVYLSTSAEAAAEYAWEMGDAAQVMPVYVKMLAPFFFDAPYARLEPTSFTLVRHLFPEPEADQIIRQISGAGDLRGQVRDRLLAMGHDGLLVQIPDEPLEVIVFDPIRIKSASGNTGFFSATSGSLVDRSAAQRARAALDFVNGLSAPRAVRGASAVPG